MDVSGSDLVALVGASVVDDLLDSGALDFSKTGNSEALQNGSLGRIRGFQTIESSRIADDEVIFMTATGVYLAHRAPDLPQGAAFGAKVSGNNLSLRYLRDYDVTHVQDRSLVDAFVGAGIMPLYNITRTEDSGSEGDTGFTAGHATVTEVPGGAVVKIDTAS